MTDREGYKMGKSKKGGVWLTVKVPRLFSFKIRAWLPPFLVAIVLTLVGRSDIATLAASFSVLLGGPDIAVLVRKVLAAGS